LAGSTVGRCTVDCLDGCYEYTAAAQADAQPFTTGPRDRARGSFLAAEGPRVGLGAAAGQVSAGTGAAMAGPGPAADLVGEQVDPDGARPVRAGRIEPDRTTRQTEGHWNPTDDELRTFIDNPKSRTLVRNLARLVLRERHWKAEAMIALGGWESVWRELGEPGPLGVLKWEACIAEIRRRAAITGDRDPAVQSGAKLDANPGPPAAGCRVEEVDGEPVRVQGAGDWDDTDRAMFLDAIRAAKAQYARDHPAVGEGATP
jgi:hypothetical protein